MISGKFNCRSGVGFRFPIKGLGILHGDQLSWRPNWKRVFQTHIRRSLSGGLKGPRWSRIVEVHTIHLA
jgi:hypothetical protein